MTNILTPLEIDAKKFGTALLKGYPAKEVDAFLDEVKSTVTELFGRVDAAEAKANGVAVGAVAKLAPVVEKVDPTLTPDVVKASTLLASANETADKVLAAAQVQATGLVTQAQAAADKLIAEATAKATAIVGDVETTRASIASKVDELTATHGKVVSLLKEGLAKLESL